MVHFVGAGPGAPDLITLRGAELLRQADVVIYAGSLVNPALLKLCPTGCAVYNSAKMTLEQVLEAMRMGENVVRLHTGDPCLYGAIREQMDALDKLNIPYDITPGVSSFCGAAAALGAAGIAVRAVAPYVKSKTTDPAVVVVDEAGRFAIPVLSGHLGGANSLAQKIAAVCGAVPVVTTATDLSGVFSVDQWAKRQNCAILNPERIKNVSGALLAGGRVEVCSPWPVAGEPPEGVSLRLMPKIAVLGVGCKRGTPQAALEAAFAALPIHPDSFCKVCSIDLKRNEPGLLAFCRAHGLELETFSAAKLQGAPGEFSPSEFVERVTGVDNVCERAAVLGSGGTLILKKRTEDGVTMAVAAAPFAPNWRWQDG